MVLAMDRSTITRSSPTEIVPSDHGGLVDIAAVADRLGVEVRHVRRLVAERRIPFIKWGHLLRFDLGDIDRWIEEHRQAPAACHTTPLR